MFSEESTKKEPELEVQLANKQENNESIVSPIEVNSATPEMPYDYYSKKIHKQESSGGDDNELDSNQ